MNLLYAKTGLIQIQACPVFTALTLRTSKNVRSPLLYIYRLKLDIKSTIKLLTIESKHTIRLSSSSYLCIKQFLFVIVAIFILQVVDLVVNSSAVTNQILAVKLNRFWFLRSPYLGQCMAVDAMPHLASVFAF